MRSPSFIDTLDKAGVLGKARNRSEGEEGEEEGEAFHRVEGLKGLKEFKVERVKGKVAERGGGGVNAE